MKIGIFGDSFAQSIIWPADVHRRVGKSWSEILSEKYDVTNFGLGGSSTYYSYDKFIKVHDKFDRVIFISSQPGRITLTDDLMLKSSAFGDLRRRQITGYNDAEDSINLLRVRDPNSTDMVKLNAALDYFTYIENRHEQLTINKLYEDAVLNLRPDCLLVPAFIKRDPNVIPLNDIAMMEISHWGDVARELLKTHREIRRSHMTEENNLILAGLMEKWTNTGKLNMSLDMFVTPDDWQRYFYKE
jgi:hypothetical protein